MTLLFDWVMLVRLSWHEKKTVFTSRLILTKFLHWYFEYMILVPLVQHSLQLILLFISLLCFNSLTLLFLLFRVIDNSLSCLDYVFNSRFILLFCSSGNLINWCSESLMIVPLVLHRVSIFFVISSFAIWETKTLLVSIFVFSAFVSA